MTPAKRTESLVLPVLLFLLLPSAAHTQGWSLDLSAGQAVYTPLSTHVGSLNAALGLRYTGTRRWLHLSSGVDLERHGPAWGTAGVGGWLGVERGSLSTGVTLDGQIFGYGETALEYGGVGGTLEVLPTLALRRGAAGVELHSGLLQTASTSAGLVGGRVAFDGGARAWGEAAPGLRVGVQTRYLQVPEGGRPYVGASAQLTRGRLGLWGSAGRWLSADDPLAGPYTAYGVGGSVGLAGGLELSASLQQEPPDPFYLSSSRRGWSVRVSRPLRRRSAPAPGVRLPDAPEVEGGRVTFRLPLSGHPEAPAVLGDFTGWRPVPMVRVGESWEVRLPVAPGVHHYGFRTAAGEWLVPASAQQVDDGMGGTSAVLVVP